MSDELQLISDENGLAVFGDAAVVDRFLASEGLATSRALSLPSAKGVLLAGSTAAEAVSALATDSGRWVKLTQESADLIAKHGLRESASGLKTGVVAGQGGQVRAFVEFAKGPGTALASPAVLAGAAGVMAQAAMRQSFEEITDYLATIDAKVDEVLRAQKDAVFARVIGIGMSVEEALTLRDHGGRVNEVTWSKVQGASSTLSETQAYALRQLDALAEKLESTRKLSDLAEAAAQAEKKAQEWLSVLARCWQLQEALALLELDRVLDAAPGDLDGHREGLRAARQQRLEVLSTTTTHLVARLDAAASRANTKVLTQPGRSRTIVRASNQVGTAVLDLHGRLGIDASRQAVGERRWLEAAAEVRTKAISAGGEGVDAARRLGQGTVRTARSTSTEVARRVSERPFLRRHDEPNA